ncbi:YiaA/YiaB family inner membrane protein [Streptomyces sp. NPDC088354]|uniref:YiaA/YiaB family inner membrane protein n=1 Tax=unclassified Streptomyces TaxID=2593676 RepID=UPI0029BBE54A|nr:YiaA/YiaB family inner membrane protein [Streptomyces sp. MI02-7b]MDX3071335.1 YiaA/YiaB family inner membrane protein [Streptomyces sp. MI02-7b]
MANPIRQHTTAAYSAQAALSFALALTAMVVGIAYLPVGPWARAFLAVALLSVVTSAFTLAKVVRDRQDEGQVTSRVDQARLDKLLAEHDPFKVDGL